MQGTTGNTVYADVEPLSNDRLYHLESASEVNLGVDGQKVEYAKLNHKPQNPKPLISVDKSTNEGTIEWLMQNQSGLTH